MVDETMRTGKNRIANSFLASTQYRPGSFNDTKYFRDVMVLKSNTNRERGVIIVKYTPSFDVFMALIDVKKIASRYFIVLEPSWAGYCDPSILQFASKKSTVFVQCFTEEDSEFLHSLNCNLIPVQLGPADWIDPHRFSGSHENGKIYDLIMVANWARHKRHDKLIAGLSKIKQAQLNVLLVGFPWGGRTKEDILRLIDHNKNSSVNYTIKENEPPDQVARLFGMSKVCVLLSEKEGDNKALVEGFFSGVPAILYDKSIGGARNRINTETGIFSTYEDLDENIIHMVNRSAEFSPRRWAVNNTGYSRATEKLNFIINKVALENGDLWLENIAEKSNSPNLTYVDKNDSERLLPELQKVSSLYKR